MSNVVQLREHQGNGSREKMADIFAKIWPERSRVEVSDLADFVLGQMFLEGYVCGSRALWETKIDGIGE